MGAGCGEEFWLVAIDTAYGMEKRSAAIQLGRIGATAGDRNRWRNIQLRQVTGKCLDDFVIRHFTTHRCRDRFTDLVVKLVDFSIPCPGPGFGNAEERKDPLRVPALLIAESVRQATIRVPVGVAAMTAEPAVARKIRVVEPLFSQFILR